MKAVLTTKTLLLAVAILLPATVEAHRDGGMAPRRAAFVRTTQECVAWNKLQRQAASDNNYDDTDDAVDDKLVTPAVSRVSSYAEELRMRETGYAYDRSRQHDASRQTQTELEFLEGTVRGR